MIFVVVKLQILLCHINEERGKMALRALFFFTLTLNYTYYEIYHRKRKVLSRTGLRSIVKNAVKNPIRPPEGPGGPLRGAWSQANFKIMIIWVTLGPLGGPRGANWVSDNQFLLYSSSWFHTLPFLSCGKFH